MFCDNDYINKYIVDLNDAQRAEWGTFKDSLKAPVHKWFTYPAGFSYKAVQHSLDKFNLNSTHTVYDPFMGSGTTNLAAKSRGVNSVGVEAHPFVYRIAKTKLCWDICPESAEYYIERIKTNYSNLHSQLSETSIEDVFPELVIKCYEENILYDLYVLREAYQTSELPEVYQDLFFVTITALLRGISSAATGWPYIAPNKKKTTSKSKVVIDEFDKLAREMVQDLLIIRDNGKDCSLTTEHTQINGDSRCTIGQIEDMSIDHVFTSPPYLNNFDYADRTRLELYYWGYAQTWGDISKNIRTKLITSATTQISRNDPKYAISDELVKNCPEVAQFLAEKVNLLGEVRKTKGGKKSYDLLVSGYFNDMYNVIKDVYRVLKHDTYALFILGDSAPYGVYIPTDVLVGEIGLGVGFDSYKIEILRTRGGKWKDNPQRHNEQLRETIVYLYKK
ncbi:DNA methyltransferase [Turicibacter sanguinis]|uniref:DNA methyltransferase n=1 Tax=Turicibacter sanguinis TaxID=154288 RepID=UPI00189FB79A|nr:DNA methyltransferase [Turicibacter sanguinis]